MAEPRPRASRDETAEAIREIRHYHRQGRDSLGELPERGAHGERAIAEQAERLHWADTKLRKSRQFARMYTRGQLNELCRFVREHRPHFGTAHVGILVTVPDPKERADLQRWCIKERVSKAALEAEIKTRFGPRRFGGRRRQVADDPVHALVQLNEMADTWLRWHAVAGEEPAGNGQAQSVLRRLPEAVRTELRKVHKAVGRLRDAVAAELERARAAR